MGYIDFLVKLNWHLLWQGGVAYLLALFCCQAFLSADRSSLADHSTTRLRIWFFITFWFPLLMVFLTAFAAVYHWPIFGSLLVWRMLRDGLDTASQHLSLIATPGPWIGYVYLAWLVLYPLYKFARSVSFTQRLLASGYEPFIWEVTEEESFKDICAQLRLDRIPSVYELDARTSAFAFRWWHPTIVIPSRLYWESDDPQEFRAILAHEAAHIKEGHLGMVAFVGLVDWLFPLSRLSLFVARRLLRREMELVADARAVVDGGVDRSALKRSLKRHVQSKTRTSALTFVQDLVVRIPYPLGRPIASSSAAAWFTYILLGVGIQFAPVAGSLIAMSFVPQIVPALQTITETPLATQEPFRAYQFPVLPVYYPRVEVPPPMPQFPILQYQRFAATPYVAAPQLRPAPYPNFTYSPTTRYLVSPTSPISQSSGAEAPVAGNPGMETTPSPLGPPTKPPPTFDAGVNMNPLPTIPAPPIPRSDQ